MVRMDKVHTTRLLHFEPVMKELINTQYTLGTTSITVAETATGEQHGQRAYQCQYHS